MRYEEGKMLKRKHISLLFVLLVAVFALCVATEAEATYNLNGICDDGPGECSVSAGGWVLEIVRGANGEFPIFCSGVDTSSYCVDKKGNPIAGYRFAYQLKAPAGSYSISTADVLCPDCGAGNQITITYPTDRSVKMLTEDPNTRYGAGDSDFVITWDSLKLDPSNKTNFSVYTTKAGAMQKGALVVTSAGYQYFNNILGPSCCEQYGGVPTVVQVGCTTATFDACTGNFVSVVSTCDSSPLTQVAGLYICRSTGGFTQCEPIEKMGPASGAFLDVSSVQGNPGDPYTGTRYYGYGSKFYKQSISGILPGACIETAPALVEDMITFDNNMVVNFKKCGDIDSVTSPDGTPATLGQLWVFESASNGKMSDTGGLVVNSGPRNGAVIHGCRYYSLGGKCYWLCP